MTLPELDAIFGSNPQPSRSNSVSIAEDPNYEDSLTTDTSDDDEYPHIITSPEMSVLLTSNGPILNHAIRLLSLRLWGTHFGRKWHFGCIEILSSHVLIYTHGRKKKAPPFAGNMQEHR